MRQAWVVVNPTKVEDAAALRAQVEPALRAGGWAVTWCATTPADPGGGLAGAAVRAGAGLVVACGGDGTVMACAGALAGSGVPLALLPAGTGNLLAHNLGLPVAPADALEVVVHGAVRRVDVGRVEGGGCFTVMAGMGFDAAMMQGAPDGLKRRLGWPAYAVSGLRRLRDRRMRLWLTVDDDPPRRVRARTVLVGNVGTLRGGVTLLPDARPDDGLLDVLVLAPRTLRDWAAVATHLLRRRRGDTGQVSRHRARRVRVEADRPEPRQLDGDPLAPGRRLDVRVDPGALLVRVPAPEAR